MKETVPVKVANGRSKFWAILAVVAFTVYCVVDIWTPETWPWNLIDALVGVTIVAACQCLFWLGYVEGRKAEAKER